MPRERPVPEPFEPESLERSLDRYLVLGLVFMVLLVAGFVTYRVREPSLRTDAAIHQRVEYVALGKRLFADNCAECHGENGTGGGDAPTLSSKQFLRSTNDAQIKALISAGISGTEMSAWSLDYGGTLTDQQVEQLTDFLRSREANAPSVPDWRESGTAP